MAEEKGTLEDFPPLGSESPYPDSTRIVMLSLIIPLCLFGVVGNALIVVRVLKTKSLRNRLNMFIVHLAVIDILIMGYISPFPIAAMLYKAYPVSEHWCKVNGAIAAFLSAVENVNFTVIAVSRYMKVCSKTTYDKYFTKMGTFILCVCMWAFSLLISLNMFMSFDEIVYSPGWHMCFKNSTTAKGVKWLFFPVLFLQYMLNITLYYRMFKVARNSQRRVNSFKNNALRQLSNASKRSQNLSCFVIFIIYIFLQTPPITQLTYFPNANATLESILQVMFCLNCSVNCIVYGLMNKNIMRDYKRVLPAVWFVRERQDSQQVPA